MTSRALPLLLCFVIACGGAAAIQERAVDPAPRVPRSVQHLRLPAGSRAAAVWLGPTGGGFVALLDGRIFAVDVSGTVRPLDVLDPPSAPLPIILHLEARGDTTAMGLGPDGAIILEGGWARRAPLPAFLSSPRAFAPIGAAALWGTSTGLYAGEGASWSSLETSGGPLRDVTEILALQGPPYNSRAWIVAGQTLRQLRLENGLDARGSPKVTWTDPTPGVALSGVRAVAKLDDDRRAVSWARGISVVSDRHIVTFHMSAGAPAAIGAGGGWAYAGWAGQLVRTNGDRWESLAHDVPFEVGAEIAVDPGTGDSALVMERGGGVLLVRAEDALLLRGLVDGGVVTSTRARLEALAPPGSSLASVEFELDGKRVASRRSPPWGIADDGGPARELGDLSFGGHTLGAIARVEDGRELRRVVRFTYASPLGRVPSYRGDIVPLFAARCARCHANGLARDLSSYEALRAQASLARAAIREARMPPDLLLDDAGRDLFTAWVDGDAPP